MQAARRCAVRDMRKLLFAPHSSLLSATHTRSHGRQRRTATRCMATSDAPTSYNWDRCARNSDRLVDASDGASVKVHRVVKADLEQQLEQHGYAAKAWAATTSFKANSELLMLPSADGHLNKVLLGVESHDDMWAHAALAKLPVGTYQLADAHGIAASNRAAIGFLLGCYSFTRYKSKSKSSGTDDHEQTAEPGGVRLVWPSGAEKLSVLAMSSAFYFCRDLITTPAEDLGPQHMVEEVLALASHHGAKASILQGEELLEHNYPAIHTVGRASHRPPVLCDFTWAPPRGEGEEVLPLLTLVGKGVCFDTGGLDLKPAASMKLMKKDMGGAALTLALAHLVMTHQLPVRLRVMVPAVENSVSENAFRPLDVLQTRSGLTVENGNTDAEGRLILCDALFEAAAERPDLLIDAATLTGAARMALGPDVPVVFSSDDRVWSDLSTAAEEEADPLWRLPLYKGYRRLIESKVADLSSTGSQPGGGAIVAALYLQEFVKGVPRWLHVDTGAYNTSSRPGRPEGGEALALRALWSFIQKRYQP
eukprot:gene5720-19004_t